MTQKSSSISGARVFWGQMLAVGLIAPGGVWGATQWTAWRLAFQPQLGPAWFRLGDWPIYPPPAFLVWWFLYDAYAPAVFARAALIAAGGAFVAIAAAVALSLWRAREARNVTTWLLTSARFRQGGKGAVDLWLA